MMTIAEAKTTLAEHRRTALTEYIASLREEGLDRDDPERFAGRVAIYAARLDVWHRDALARLDFLVAPPIGVLN